MLVSSPFVTVAYPPWLTPCFYDDRNFGVWQRTEGLLPLNTQSVLYITIHLHRDLPTSSLARNLLLPISIGLSPLYPARPSDLQISNGSILHPAFTGLQSGQE